MPTHSLGCPHARVRRLQGASALGRPGGAHVPTPAGDRAWAADGGPRPVAADIPRVRACRVLGRGKIAGFHLLHDPSGVHDENPVAKGRHQPQVVRHEDEAHPAPGDQFVQDGEHLQLDRDVERRRRLVGDQQVGIRNEHHRDHRPLAHAARHFVRIELVHASGIVDVHRFEGRQRPRARIPAPTPANAHAASRRSGRRWTSPDSTRTWGPAAPSRCARRGARAAAAAGNAGDRRR